MVEAVTKLLDGVFDVVMLWELSLSLGDWHHVGMKEPLREII